jgi:hypothetical protein
MRLPWSPHCVAHLASVKQVDQVKVEVTLKPLDIMVSTMQHLRSAVDRSARKHQICQHTVHRQRSRLWCQPPHVAPLIPLHINSVQQQEAPPTLTTEGSAKMGASAGPSWFLRARQSTTQSLVRLDSCIRHVNPWKDLG